MVLNMWSNAFSPHTSPIEDNNNDMEYILEPKKYEYLTVILNLLHLYNEICPKLLDTSTDIPADTLLNTLNKLEEDISVDEFNATKAKAIQFLVILQPYKFLPHKVGEI